MNRLGLLMIILIYSTATRFIRANVAPSTFLTLAIKRVDTAGCLPAIIPF